MLVERLELVDFRNYTNATFELTAGITAVVGDNGQGKTNLVEALAYLATLESFRGAPNEALIRAGAEQAVIRATIRHDDGRSALIEAELSRAGRNRVFVNRQRLQRSRDLLGVVRVSVFSPDDLAIVKAGPGQRRRFLDDVLVALATKYDALRLELDRVLRQRGTLLKQAGPRPGPEVLSTLDVWDLRLADLGERLGHARSTLVTRLTPYVIESYEHLAGAPVPVEVVYEPRWRHTGLAEALAAARDEDLRRQASTVGPHRDEVELVINGLPARTHASQGEQRTLALALRLASHRLVMERTGSTPVLVLDDVLSELDASRGAALLSLMPPGQVVLTSAGTVPGAEPPPAVLRLRNGVVLGSA